MADSDVEHPLVISYVAGRYLVYDVNVVSHLRAVWHMCGTLFGTLPQAQQQNIFLGLPLELMNEEVKLLVEKGAATVVDDKTRHEDAVGSLSQDDVNEIQLLKSKEQERLALENLEESKKRKEEAIQNAKASGKWKDRPRKAAKTQTASLLEEEGESVAMLDMPAPAPKMGPEEALVKQYIIPMPSESIGAYSLKRPGGSLHIPDVPNARYEVYKALQSLGYFLSPGLRFGCQFLAYPGDPLRFHSHFLVKSLEWDEAMPIMNLVGGGRLGTGVKKGWMIAGKARGPVTEVSQTEEAVDAEGIRTFCVEWGGFG